MPPSPASPDRAAAIDDRVLAIVAALAREARAGGGAPPRVDLDSNLERGIGFDSLERAELLLRLEQAFGVRLPPHTLATAETPRDLLRAVHAGAPVATGAANLQVVAPTPLAEPVDLVPREAATLIEVLDWHADRHPQRTHLTLLTETESGSVAEALTYGALRDEAARVAAGLAARGVEPGQCVAIMLPTSRDFFRAFFGVLLAGAVPVPIYPPARRSQLEEHLARQSGILDNCLATALITVPEAGRFGRLLRASTPTLKEIVAVADLDASPLPAPMGRPGPQDIAFLQYTSGSTGNPKGVVLTHANLLANIRAIGPAIGVLPTDVFVSWLPLYHDMGLIGAWFGTLYYAVPLVVMPPTDFLGRPEHWLRTIQRFRGTLSAGPNFAYEICATRLDPSRLAGLDLSSWRIAFNGAEAVSPDTLDRFAARFAPFGFDPRAQTPVYGLAESAVGLAFPPHGRGPLIDRVDRARLARSGVATPAAPDDPCPLRVVACGQPMREHEIRVVDAGGRELPERHEGRIEFRGPSATSGYFRNPEATRKLFHGPWLDTGDLGYIAAGEIYVTGRAKDVIIRGGQHIHPQEAENAIGAIAGIRKGCVTVFGVPDRDTGTERVVVVAETRETDADRREGLRRIVAERMAALLGGPPDDIVLAPPYTVLKTSSGKLRRAACRELYEQGMKHAGPRALWLQSLRLAAGGVAGSVHRAWMRIADVLFGLRAWALVVPLGLVALVLTMLLPGVTRRRRAAKALARAFVAASGLPVQIAGDEHFPTTGPMLVVANHASYLDGVVLAAFLPDRCRFVAKRELERSVAMRLLLRGIGTRFVERFDVEGSVDAAREMQTLAACGESLVFFPEGTFRREPGLRPFHMGAFVAAAAAPMPVVPVALRGMRSVLRDGQWLPHRGVVQIVVDPPLVAEGRDWNAAVRLRDRARAAILAGCGEPDLTH